MSLVVQRKPPERLVDAPDYRAAQLLIAFCGIALTIASYWLDFGPGTFLTALPGDLLFLSGAGWAVYESHKHKETKIEIMALFATALIFGLIAQALNHMAPLANLYIPLNLGLGTLSTLFLARGAILMSRKHQ